MEFATNHLSINIKIKSYFWQHFITNFDPDNNNYTQITLPLSYTSKFCKQLPPSVTLII